MSRIFHRPMFRKGGSAGGITSGLRRGYANGEDVQISDELLGSTDYQGGTTTSDLINKEVVEEKETPRLSYSDFGEIKPPEAPGFDWGSFGLNLMSGPSTGDFWSDVGEAGKEPYSRYKQGKAAYDMNKYKHKLAERQFGLEVYKAMNKDDKLRVQQEMKFYMDQGMTEEEAFNQVIYRKKQHPDETKRIQEQAILDEQKENLNVLINRYADSDIGQGVPLTPEYAKRVHNFHTWADDNKLLYQPYYAVIDNTDITLSKLQPNPDGSGKLMLPEDVDNETYRPGFHYIEPQSNTVWLVSESGQELIPVEMN